MNIDEIVRRIFHVQFSSKRKMAKTFLRFQEHFESPQFRGKIFTHDEFREWYTKNSKQGKKTGRFTYHDDWAGFNVPSSILSPFYDGKFDPLTPEEKQLLDAFEEQRGKRFYLISTTGAHPLDVKHEVAHGLFYLNSSYRQEVTAALKGMSARDRAAIDAYFQASVYHPKSWLDETHAYALTDAEKIIKAGANRRRVRRVQKHLESIFKKYCDL